MLSEALSQAIQLLLEHSDIIVLTELPKPDKEDPKLNLTQAQNKYDEFTPLNFLKQKG